MAHVGCDVVLTAVRVQLLVHPLDGHLSQVCEVLCWPGHHLLLTLLCLIAALDDFVGPGRNQRLGRRYCDLVLQLL